MYALVYSALPQVSTSGVSCVELPLFPLCFTASIPCAQTVEASPCGPWTVITFRLLPSLREG